MKISMISFTAIGSHLAEKLAEELRSSSTFEEVSCTDGRHHHKEQEESLQDWTEEHFQQGNGMIFIGACGIAVRSIAPFLKSKTTDPAVLVLDEKGKFVIPILSGHIGEANLLAERIAKLTGGEAVLTTATDVNQLFAVDVFASRNHLEIADMEKAKMLSARLLDQRSVIGYIPAKIAEEIQIDGKMPHGLQFLTMVENPEKRLQKQEQHSFRQVIEHPLVSPQVPYFYISPYRIDELDALQLIPRSLILGIGCRKGKCAQELEAFLMELLKQEKLSLSAFDKITSIDLKKEEPGICELAQKLNLPFETYSADILSVMPGVYEGSAFVKQTTGVDNVCERSVMAAGADRVLIRKQASNGMTLAVGIRKEIYHVS